MPIVTISHQIGSGGREIGQAVAGALGFDYVDRQVVEGVAQQLGISEDVAKDMDEKAQSTVLRILSFLTGGTTTGLAPAAVPLPDEVQVDEREYHAATVKVLEAAAQSNRVVIAGHGANFALAHRKGVLNVFIFASKEQRLATLTAREKISPSEAADRLAQNDHDREHYIKTFYKAHWHSLIHYHLLINTAVLKPKLAVDLIVEAVKGSTL